LVDESRHQLHFIDETDPAKSWAIPLDRASRDIQLVGAGRAMISNGSGYTLYDLATRKAEKEMRKPELAGTMSARRRPDGTTWIGANQKGIAVFELDAGDRLIRTMRFPELTNLRLMRRTPEGTILLAENKGLTEVTFDAGAPAGGRIVRRIALPRGHNTYMGLKTAAGTYLVSGGYANALFELRADGTPVRTYEAAPSQGLITKFYAGFQLLRNGHLVVSHWTGHGANDSAKGWQAIEFEPGGNRVWTWHQPATAGTAHGILVIDDLDLNAFLDDTGGVLGPVQ
jgi:hypothetical protein